MDTPGELNRAKADEALRGLFREGGTLHAPEGIDARIMERIAIAQGSLKGDDRPLVPKWAWMAAAGIIGSLAALSGPGTLKVPAFGTAWMPRLTGTLNSPWILMALASATLLLALEMWLSRRRLATVPVDQSNSFTTARAAS